MGGKPRQPISRRIFGGIRALMLAIAGYLLGWGLPAVGVSTPFIPLIVSVGVALVAFAVLTYDIVSDFFKRLNWPRWSRILTIVLIWFVVAGGTYYWSYNSITISNATLTIPIQQVTTSDNQTAHTLDVTFSLGISNVGNGTAYHIRAQQLYIDADSILNGELPKNKAGYNETSMVNPLRPPEGVIWTFIVPLAYEDVEGAKVYDTKRLFLYCKITYSDSPNNSDRPYCAEYWYSYDINRQTVVSMLTEEQQSLFKPIVKSHFPK